MAVILGKLPFRILLTAGSLLLIAVVLTCYGLAVSEGHVPAWLPSISSCGDKPPEKFIFTYGMLAVAALLFLESVCIYGADKPFSGSLPILLTSSVATFFLGIVGSVCSACDHGTGVHGCKYNNYYYRNLYANIPTKLVVHVCCHDNIISSSVTVLLQITALHLFFVYLGKW